MSLWNNVKEMKCRHRVQNPLKIIFYCSNILFSQNVSTDIYVLLMFPNMYPGIAQLVGPAFGLKGPGFKSWVLPTQLMSNTLCAWRSILSIPFPRGLAHNTRDGLLRKLADINNRPILTTFKSQSMLIQPICKINELKAIGSVCLDGS